MKTMWKNVSSKYVYLLYVEIAFYSLILFIAATVFTSPQQMPSLRLPVYGVVALLILWMFWLATRRAKAIGYRFNEEEFEIKKGIMFRSQHSIPYGRIQYVEASSNPVSQKLALQKLSIRTAAAKFGTIVLPGLDQDVAEELRQHISQRAEDKMVQL